MGSCPVNPAASHPLLVATIRNAPHILVSTWWGPINGNVGIIRTYYQASLASNVMTIWNMIQGATCFPGTNATFLDMNSVSNDIAA